MTTGPREPDKLAGFVLAMLGLVMFGSTSPFGLVLCWEWLRDPTRRADLRRFDAVGFVLAIPGAAFWAYLSYWFSLYYMGGTPEPFALYWWVFASWTVVRWRRIFRRPVV